MIELELFRPRNVSDGEDDDDNDAASQSETTYAPPKVFVKFADSR